MEPARLTPGRALEVAFEIARGEGRAALIPFITAGDPSIAVTEQILDALADGGADVIELGIPFSDPIADGPAIQASSHRALVAGARVEHVFRLVQRFSQRQSVPVVLFGYYNPVLAMGEDAFAQSARVNGTAGSLVVDLSFEEARGFRDKMSIEGLHLISLVAPTTPEERLIPIAEVSTGFIYYVSMVGVTGQQLTGFDAVKERVEVIRERTDTPIAVGFGVRSGDDVAEVAKFADGVVVGSELVKRIHEAGPDAAAGVARRFIAELRDRTKR